MFESGMIIQNRYEIIEEVGSGGMSVVYKAKCHVLNRFVAIKVLKPEFSDDKSFVSKFRIEAQSAAGLSHPNIVNVFDVGEEDGFYYIVMELVEGITLKEYIQQNGRLPYQTALDFIMQIAAGIEVAHEHHTIHRDIKPQNIIVSKNGTVKVTDFGIAKAATSNTIASSAMGSVHYISPEQARGGYSDERSDIYSLGITLYEMLTGRVPFEGENNVTVALMHIQSEIIPPREYYPDIPVGLENIVLKATQKKPEQRYLTTNAMLADLRKLAMDPNAEVGVVGGMIPNNVPTIQISEDEIAAINSAAGGNISMFPVSQKSNTELDEANRALESLYNDEYDEEEDTLFRKPGNYAEEEDEYDESGLDPKMERVVTIAAIVATVVIAIVIIVAIVSISGAFKHPKKITEVTTEATTESSIMPGVIGMEESEATTLLDEKRIAYVIERDFSSSIEAGKVMEQSIIKGTEIAPGEKVTLIISKGQEEIDVPDVVGKTLEEATTMLKSAGFEVSEDDEYDEEVAENTIIRQSPGANSKAAKGSKVTIIVSKGEEVKVAEVPDLKKKTVSEAETALSEKNLKLGSVKQEWDDKIEEGKVIAQSIAAGTEVKEGTAIDITISKGKKPTEATTYTASFSGSISNASYAFAEGEAVRVTVTLKVDNASYTIVDDTLSEGSFPVSLAEVPEIDGLPSNNAQLVYSIKNSAGADITGYFTSTAQAKLKKVE